MTKETKYFDSIFTSMHSLNKGIPLYGSLEVTYLCNYRCIHCSIVNCADRGREELKLSQIQKIIDQISEAGCLFLVITGGEPFIRKDFVEIYQYIKKKGILVILDTNATLMTPQIVRVLADNPPHGIETTLYSLNANRFDSITGVRGSFDRFMKGFNLLIKYKIPISCVRTPCMKMNKNDIVEVKKYIEDRGIRFYKYHFIDCSLNGTDRPLEHLLSPEEVIAEERGDSLKISLQDTSINGCLPQSWQAFIINPYGEIDFCRRTPCFPEGSLDISNGGFQRNWSHYLHKIKFFRDKAVCVCKNCKLFSFCGQCSNYEKLNRINSKFKNYYCRLAELRSKP